MPIEDFESTIASAKSSIPLWVHAQSNIWMYGASKGEDFEKGKGMIKIDEDYNPEPFLEEKFEPTTWRDILATLDVCVTKQSPTFFCDDNGYDMIAIHMISIIHEIDTKELANKEEDRGEDNKGEKIEKIAKVTIEMKHLNIREEVSICDILLDAKGTKENKETEIEIDDPHGPICYDALDELDEFEDEPELVTILMQDGREVELPNNLLEHEKRHIWQCQARIKGEWYILENKGKTHYLMIVNDRDCAKDKIPGCCVEDIK